MIAGAPAGHIAGDVVVDAVLTASIDSATSYDYTGVAGFLFQKSIILKDGADYMSIDTPHVVVANILQNPAALYFAPDDITIDDLLIDPSGKLLLDRVTSRIYAGSSFNRSLFAEPFIRTSHQASRRVSFNQGRTPNGY